MQKWLFFVLLLCCSAFSEYISSVIVIDHSGSMSIYDSTAYRYKLASNLIDSLHSRNPQNEIGIVVFSNQLMFNADSNTVFNKLYSESLWTDSYLPLLKLGSNYDGRSGKDILKWCIELSDSTDIYGNKYLMNGYYGLNGRSDAFNSPAKYNGTTDISLAFEAVRDAFSTCANSKENQYVIFLSDGVSQNCDKERQSSIKDYTMGLNIPAIYTVMFSNLIPDTMNIMMNNIKENGYSINNVNSVLSKSNQTSLGINSVISWFEKPSSTISSGIQKTGNYHKNRYQLSLFNNKTSGYRYSLNGQIILTPSIVNTIVITK